MRGAGGGLGSWMIGTVATGAVFLPTPKPKRLLLGTARWVPAVGVQVSGLYRLCSPSTGSR